MNVRLSFLVTVLITACNGNPDQPQSNAENLLLHSFNYLEKGNIGASWKGYLESVYAYNDLGKDLPPQGYILASSLCILALKKGNEKVPCRRFRFGDEEPVTINNRDQTPDESISYLEPAMASGDFDNASIQKLIACYRASAQDQSVNCATLGIELIRPFFQPVSK